MRYSLIVAIALVSFATQALALPFNQDMVGDQYITGSMMRSKPQSSVPVGSLKYRQEGKAAAANLVNPSAGDKTSAQSGQRLFKVNCSVCHGNWVGGKHQPATLNPSIPSMDLAHPMYASRTDGQIFATIKYGGLAVMPAYGWKLSTQEHWDIVNYVRQVQKGE